VAVVLSFSSDDLLAKTRQLILEQGGHRVFTVFDVKAAERACSEEAIDVAVIGQAIPRHERLRIRDLVRSKCQGAMILELYLPSENAALSDADDCLQVPTEAATELLDRIGALLDRRQLLSQRKTAN
jgi:DNA-binding response OmpR family regulator